MEFTKYDLGFLPRGTIVEVTLVGNAANVRLMNSSDFSNYKAGRRHSYFGGLITQSPARIPVPQAGHWYVTVDMQGLRGQTRSSIRTIPLESVSPLPEYVQPPAQSLSSLVRPAHPESGGEEGIPGEMATPEYDVFISHATEDKEELVRPLANELLSLGIRVWYDEFTLRLGDSLRRKIDAGLANSRFGVVVLSHAFFAKNWPQYELDGLVTREMTGQQIILPLWHRITKNEVIAKSPSLADKVARNTADVTIEELAAEIADVIQKSG